MRSREGLHKRSSRDLKIYLGSGSSDEIFQENMEYEAPRQNFQSSNVKIYVITLKDLSYNETS